MAWTSPRTWVAGETVTSVMLNAHLRDNLNALNIKPNFRQIITTNVTLPATSADIVTTGSMTWQGGPVLVGWSGGTLLNSTGVSQTPVFQAYVDGAAKSPQSRAGQNFDGIITTGNEHNIRPAVLMLTPAEVPAGSHTISLRETSNMGSGGAATLKGTASSFTVFVVEL